MTKLIQWILGKILIAQTTRPRLVFLSALLLAAASVWYTVENLGFQTSQKDLISPKDRLIQLAEQVNQFEQLDSFIVVIESPDPRTSLSFLRVLASRLEPDKENYREIFYRVDPEQFRRWALLYLDAKDLQAIRNNLKEHRQFITEISKSPTLNNFFEQINQEMASKMVGELFTGFLGESGSKGEQEPLDLDFLIRTLKGMKGFLEGETDYVSPWDSLFTKVALDESEEGHFWTKGKKYLLLFVTPTEKQDFAGTLHSLQALRAAVAQVKAEFPGVKAGVTGPEALNVDQMGTALQDMSLATLLSAGGVAVLLIIFWWGLRRPLLEMIRLVIDMCLTFGVTTLFVGHLNILSVTFAPLILGLGIDYGAHWFARYMEEEKRGFADKKYALRSIMEKLAPGIVLAGIAAAFSFFPLVLTGFKGLVELGLICAMGMCITTFTSLALLPALIMIFDRPKLNPNLHLAHSSSIQPFFVFTSRRAAILLTIGIVGFAFSVWGATKVRFDLNMLRLQSSDVESVIWEKKLLEGSELSSVYGGVLARSLAEVQQKTKALEALPAVSRVESIVDLLPPDQEEKIAFLRKLKPDVPRMKSSKPASDSFDTGKLDRTLGRIRFKMVEDADSQWGVNKPLARQMAEVRQLIDDIQGRIHSPEPARAEKALASFEKKLLSDMEDKLEILRANVNTRPLGLEDLPQTLRQRFMSRNELFLIRVFPQENIWEPALLGRFVDQIRSVDPDAVGDPVTLYVFTQAFRDACIKAAVYALIFIFVLLLLAFRGLRSTLLALLPLVVGTVWTFGFMHVLRVDLNLANSIFLPLVVGASVEYAILILYRWGQRDKEKPGTVLPRSTALGVILAGFTTTVGFGSLCISSHQGIFSLGLLTTVGSLAILAAAIFLLPALLYFLDNPNKTRQAPDA